MQDSSDEDITCVNPSTGLGQLNREGNRLATERDERSAFDLKLIPGYGDDPKRKPKEFAPRQVQMMALSMIVLLVKS